MRDLRRIILHCSDTEDGPNLDFKAIRRYHMESNKWHDIGYHFVFERIGTMYAVTAGRPIRVEGAHTAGQNYDSVGVCVVGKFDKEVPELVFAGVADFLAFLAPTLAITAQDIFFHRNFTDYKTCPDLAWDLQALRDAVKQRMEPHGTLIMRGGYR